MTLNPSEQLYEVAFDERQERWYVAQRSDRRIQLSRASLQQLVSLYNRIHRGNPLTLIERRALEQLSEERRELHHTVRELYDYIDAEAAAEDGAPAPLVNLPPPGSWWQRTRFQVERFLWRFRQGAA